MGCNSDYMNQTKKEKELQETAQLLVFAMKVTGKKPTKEVIAAADDYYCKLDLVPKLCRFMRDYEFNVFAGLIERLTGEEDFGITEGEDYFAKHVMYARLLLWWRIHQQADFVREAAEAKDKKKTSKKAHAASKLTAAERKALGIDAEGNPL